MIAKVGPAALTLVLGLRVQIWHMIWGGLVVRGEIRYDDAILVSIQACGLGWRGAMIVTCFGDVLGKVCARG